MKTINVTVESFAKAMKIEAAGAANHVLQVLEKMGIAKLVGTVIVDNGLRGKRPYVYALPEKVSFEVLGAIESEVKERGAKPAKKEKTAKVAKAVKTTKATKKVAKKVKKTKAVKAPAAPTAPAENTEPTAPAAPVTPVLAEIIR